MEFEWDPGKRAANILKHGLDFEDACEIFENRHAVKIDKRRNYGEVRYQCIGVLNNRIVVLVYTIRGNVCRIISLRKANEKEQSKFYNRLGSC